MVVPVAHSKENTDNGLRVKTVKKRSRPLNGNRLELWLNDNNNMYPNKEIKEMLAIESDLTVNQVNRWFANRRRKHKLRTCSSPASSTEQSGIGCSSPVDSEPDKGSGSGGAASDAAAVPAPFPPSFNHIAQGFLSNTGNLPSVAGLMQSNKTATEVSKCIDSNNNKDTSTGVDTTATRVSPSVSNNTGLERFLVTDPSKLGLTLPLPFPSQHTSAVATAGQMTAANIAHQHNNYHTKDELLATPPAIAHPSLQHGFYHPQHAAAGALFPPPPPTAAAQAAFAASVDYGQGLMNPYLWGAATAFASTTAFQQAAPWIGQEAVLAHANRSFPAVTSVHSSLASMSMNTNTNSSLLSGRVTPLKDSVHSGCVTPLKDSVHSGRVTPLKDSVHSGRVIPLKDSVGVEFQPDDKDTDVASFMSELTEQESIAVAVLAGFALQRKETDSLIVRA